MATANPSTVAITLVLAFLAVNVSRGAEGACSLAGNVRLNGVAVAEGKLLLRMPGGKAVLETPIEAGKFELLMVTAGKYEIAIQGKDVPEKYSSLDVTALKVELKAGNNQIEFELKSK